MGWEMDTQEAFEYWGWHGEERELFAEQVAAQAPQVFAICELDRDEVDGEPTGGRVVAWGMAGPDCAEVFSADGRMHGSFESVASAMEVYNLSGEVGIVRPA